MVAEIRKRLNICPLIYSLSLTNAVRHMQKINFEELDKEHAEAVHFTDAIEVIAEASKRTMCEGALLMVRAMRAFKGDYPHNLCEFRFYRYSRDQGFTSDKDLENKSLKFLSKIASGCKFPQASAGFGPDIYLVDGFQIYEGFYFKKTELILFLLHNDMAVPVEFSDGLSAAIKLYEQYKKLSRKGADNTSADPLSADEAITALAAEPVKWGRFAGKETALMMIAGLAVALEQSGGRYLRGARLNKSAVVEAARKAINDYGKGTEITSKAMTDLLRAALESHIVKTEP